MSLNLNIQVQESFQEVKKLNWLYFHVFRRQESGVKTMSNLYPYMGKGIHTHFAYVTNLLEAIEYLPKMQGQLLNVIIHK